MENPVPYRSKTEAVEGYLRRKILQGQIRSGQRLLQDAVARELGVSSTPVREALRRLEAEGLVTYLPHKGVTAREVDPKRAHEVFALRAVLEGYSTREAALRLTDADLQNLERLQSEMHAYLAASDIHNFAAVNDQWHMTIHRAAGSEILRQMVSWLWRISPWDTLWVIPGRAQAALHEHELILKRLNQRDPIAAGEAMVEHIRSGGRALLQFLQTRSLQETSPS